MTSRALNGRLRCRHSWSPPCACPAAAHSRVNHCGRLHDLSITIQARGMASRNAQSTAREWTGVRITLMHTDVLCSLVTVVLHGKRSICMLYNACGQPSLTCRDLLASFSGLKPRRHGCERLGFRSGCAVPAPLVGSQTTNGQHGSSCSHCRHGAGSTSMLQSQPAIPQERRRMPADCRVCTSRAPCLLRCLLAVCTVVSPLIVLRLEQRHPLRHFLAVLKH